MHVCVGQPGPGAVLRRIRRPRLRPGGPVRIRPHPVEVGGAAQRPAAPVQQWEERRSGLLPLCSDLGTPILKERVIFIMKLKKRSAAALALAAILVLGTTVAFATGPLQEETTPQAPASQDVLPAATEDPSGNPDHTAEAEDKTMKPDTPGETASIPMEADGSEPSGSR